MLLQVFDEGRLSDSQGRLIDFRNTVIIMTSNLSANELIHIQDKKRKFNIARKIVSNHFAPEFVNRLDDIIVFNQLSKDAIISICKIQLNRVTVLLQSTRGVKLSFHDNAVNWLAENGFEPEFGARPVKRLIQSKILDPLATLILEVNINDIV